MSDDVNAAVDRLRRQAQLIRTSLAALERDLAWRPELVWSDVLSQFNNVKRHMDNLRDETDPMLNYFLLFPRALPANPADVPLLLSTRKLPVMEARDERLKGLAAQAPLAGARIEAHNALVASLLQATTAGVEAEEEDVDMAPADPLDAKKGDAFRRADAWPPFL